MSKTLSAGASAQFDSEVKHAYQGGRRLAGTMAVRAGIVGDTYNFRSLTKGIANQKNTSEDVTPMNVTHAKIPVTLQNWNAPEYTDIFDAATVNFSERAELSTVIGEALGRRYDQLSIDAMIAASSLAGTVSTDIGGTGTDINVAKLRRAKRYLDDQGVPPGGRHLACSANGMESLLGQTEATSADYNSVRALVSGEINTFLGFQFHVIESRAEGSLPVAASVRTNLAWHERAVGLAEGSLERMSTVDWVPVKTSWLSNGFLKAGSIARDTKGIVKLTCTEPA
jgi:hypothetical protein